MDIKFILVLIFGTLSCVASLTYFAIALENRKAVPKGQVWRDWATGCFFLIVAVILIAQVQDYTIVHRR